MWWSGTCMFPACWLCVLLAVVSSDVVSEIILRKVGDEVVLSPGKIQEPITSIEWKRGENIAVQWDKDGLFDCFLQFKGHCRLNTSNGELTITGLFQNHSGVYKPEINHQIDGVEIHLKVLRPVPEPTVTKQCDNKMTSCTLTCDGDMTGVEQVTYTWWSDNNVASSSQEHIITKDDSLDIKEFSCKLRNPVSEARSQPFSNPFTTRDSFGGKMNISSGLTVFICLLVAVLLLVAVHRCKAGMWFFQKASMPWEADFWRKSPRDAAESNGTTAQERGQMDEETPMT